MRKITALILALLMVLVVFGVSCTDDKKISTTTSTSTTDNSTTLPNGNTSSTGTTTPILDETTTTSSDSTSSTAKPSEPTPDESTSSSSTAKPSEPTPDPAPECKHKFREWTIIDEPSCTKEGEELRQCLNCDYFETRATKKLPHTEMTVAGEAPSCTETGLTDGVVCAICNTVLVEQEEIPEVPHKEEIIPAVEPTYESAGSTEGVKCSVCGNLIVEPEDIPMLTKNISYYVDGVMQSSAPQKGNYVVYISSLDSLSRAKWNYDKWTYENTSSSKNYSIYFFSVKELYSSADAMKNSAGSYSSGTLVGTKAYFEGSSIGAAVYKIGTSSSTGSVSLASGKYANIEPFAVGSDKVITVDMFGTRANGTTDDAKTINTAFKFSDCTVIEFEGSEYLQKTGIAFNKSNVTVNGYGAKISNEYTDGQVHWTDFEIMNAQNVTLKNITLYLSETDGKGVLFKNNDHVQLLIRDSAYITVEGVTVSCPNNTTNDRHVTSIWANSGISNITIKNCTVKNFSKSSVGGGIWVSAGSGQTATGIKILNNHIEKSSHDETLAFFTGDFDDILVEGNYIYTHDEPVGDPSAHAIGFGVWGNISVVKNAIFRNNDVDVVAKNDAFVFSSIDGLEIYDNKIILRNNSPTDPLVYGVFRVAEPSNTTQKNLKIYNNDITVYNTNNSTMAALVYDMDSNCSIYGNTFTVHTNIGKIVEGTKNDANFYDNKVVLYDGISNSYDKYLTNNEITVK